MNEDLSATDSSAASRPRTAGGMLRQARQAQGLHIAALAAAIKVLPRKLELLESDQFDQLHDATFARALAQTVCRTLKIDPAPVLALMPPAHGSRIEQVAEGLNTPFRERPGRLVPKEWVSGKNPALWLLAVLIIATVGLYVTPAGWMPFPKAAVTRAASAAASATADTADAAASATSPDALAAAPSASVAEPSSTSSLPTTATQEVMPPASQTEPAEAAGTLQLRPIEVSWVEVIDARGQSLISRLVQPGEEVGLDGVLPFKVRIGNANKMKAVFRGQPLELAAFTRDNVARLELK